jgi:LEA14-like dessication related protein
MKILKLFIILLIIILLSHCADLMKIVKKGSIENPDVRISKTKLTGLSFDQADLVFDIEINNPNPISISLAGFDYDLLLNNNSFLKGDQNRQMEIKANDITTIQLPLTLLYDNIFKTYQSLKNEDKITYSLKTGLSFNLPVLGVVRIPVSTSGDIPSIKIPAVSLNSIKLKRLTLTGAEIDLAIGINNPNSFGFIINILQYGLTINQAKWVDGQTSENTNIRGKNNNILQIPFSLNFIQISSSLYQEISSGRSLNYQFNGEASLSSSLDMLGDVKLPFDIAGKIDLTK